MIQFCCWVRVPISSYYLPILYCKEYTPNLELASNTESDISWVVINQSINQ